MKLSEPHAFGGMLPQLTRVAGEWLARVALGKVSGSARAPPHLTGSPWEHLASHGTIEHLGKAGL
jgi:hypothetical protein